MDYVQFDKDDVFEKIKRIQTLDKRSKNRATDLLSHNLKSDLIAASFDSFYFLSDEKLFGKLPNIYQKAYVSNLYSSARLALHHVDDMLRYFSLDNDKLGKSASTSLVNILNETSEFLPAKDNVLDLGDLSLERIKLLEQCDLFYNLSFYTFNSEFSKNFRKNEHSLKDDINTFLTNSFFENNYVDMSFPKFDDIKTDVDYFNNAILPLIKNIVHHAFNPKNDVYDRISDASFRKSFMVYSEVDKEKQKFYVYVRDFGFGMRPKVRDEIFKKKISTKKDSQTVHGMGLWGVKQFVERYGGDIEVSSELGKSTTFRFTIPYEDEYYGVYMQNSRTLQHKAAYLKS